MDQHGLCTSTQWGVEYFCFPKVGIGLAVAFSTSWDVCFSDFVQGAIQVYISDSFMSTSVCPDCMQSEIKCWGNASGSPFLTQRPGEGDRRRDLYDPWPGRLHLSPVLRLPASIYYMAGRQYYEKLSLMTLKSYEAGDTLPSLQIYSEA